MSKQEYYKYSKILSIDIRDCSLSLVIFKIEENWVIKQSWFLKHPLYFHNDMSDLKRSKRHCSFTQRTCHLIDNIRLVYKAIREINE